MIFDKKYIINKLTNLSILFFLLRATFFDELIYTLLGILIGIKNGYEFYKDKQYVVSFVNFTISLCLSGLPFLIFPAIINLIIS